MLASTFIPKVAGVTPSYYAGAEVGYITMDTKMTSSADGNRFGGFLGDGDRTKLSAQDINGGLHIGAGLSFDTSIKTYLGLEGFVLFSGLDSHDSRAAFDIRNANNTRFKQKETFGAVLRG